MSNRIIAALLSLTLLLSLVSCTEPDKVYGHCEMLIPLSEDFVEVKSADFDKAYTNGRYTLTLLRLSFVAMVNEGIPETMSTYEFAEFWLERCERSANIIKEDITYCEYYDAISAEEYFYIEAFYRSQYAYFVLLFATEAEAEEDGRSYFLELARSVVFTDD